MDSKTLDVKQFFDEAAKIKEERGNNYDNGGKSAYELALDLFKDPKNKYLVAIWPLAQKVSRLVTLASEANNGHFDVEAWDDTSKDLANYTAMQWLAICKPTLDSKPAVDSNVDMIKAKDLKYVGSNKD